MEMNFYNISCNFYSC